MALEPKSNILRRRIASRAFVANGVDTFDLFRAYDNMAVIVRVSGTITLSVAATSVKNLAPAQLIANMELLSDGSKAIEQTNGRLAAAANFERKGRRRLTPPGAGIATHTVEAYFRLDRANYDGPRPKDSALHTVFPFMSLWQLRITYGTPADCFVGGTVSASNLTVEVFQDDVQEFVAGDATEGKFIRVQSLQEVIVDANNSNLEIRLPVGGLSRGAKIIALDENGNLSDDVVTNVELRIGANVRINLPFKALRGINAGDYELAQGDDLVGIAYADMMPDGQLTKAFDARAASEYKLILNVVKPAGGNGKVIVGAVDFIEQSAAA